METSIELFKQPLNLLQQTDIANNVIFAIQDGSINPILAEITLKSLQNVIEAIRKTEVIKSITREETDKYGKKFDIFGATVENCNRTTYDYSVCNDEILNSLEAEKERLEAQIKIRQKILQSGCDVSTGEVLKQPISKTTDYLKITFKK